jgi:hypothetical protein
MCFKRFLALITAGVLGMGLVIVASISPAFASVQETLYVSTTGTGSTCVVLIPCSLSSAQSKLEADAPSATGDIDIQLAGGTYKLPSGLTLTSADNAANGHSVNWLAAPGATPVLSGGAAVAGWTRVGTSSVWQASYTGANTRQIYVNGLRASIVSQDATQVFTSLTKTTTGYTYTASGPNSWTNTSGVDLVYAGGITQAWDWAESICPTSSIASGVITMQTPCFANGSTANPWPSFGIPTAVENNKALLGTPGQFYIDNGAGQMFYVPRIGEDMTTASVVAPQVQSLVSVSSATHVNFSGIQFAFATWTFAGQGVLDHQADSLFTTDFNTSVMLPANVQCSGCTNVAFTGNTFTHLGGAGLSLDLGSGNTVRGNTFTDISSSGIQLGEGPVKVPSTVESGDTVSNNEVNNVANGYYGGVGIFAGWVANTTISHNDVWNVPYTGISLGWGWGDPAQPSPMVNNHIDYNTVHDVMNSSLSDGGAIYVNGTELTSPSSSVVGNYVYQIGEYTAALYLDNGASNFAVQYNVIGGYSPAWLMLNYGAGYHAVNNTVTNNYASDTAGPQYTDNGPNNTVTSNSAGLATWPAAAQAIISAAGLEPAYSQLAGTSPQTNLAYNKPATGSSTYSSSTAATNANDGSDKSEWVTATGDMNGSWQTDLGASYPLSDIQVLFRQDGYGWPTETQNFNVEVSNSANLASGQTIECAIGAQALPLQSRFDCAIPSGTWRYVSIVKTDHSTTTDLALGEVRAFGQARANIASAQYASAANTYSASFPASNAVDGDVNTIYSGTGTGGGWWELSLPASHAMTQVNVVFRNDYDNPGERKNLAIWVSNIANMSSGYTVACTVGANPLPFASTYTCIPPAGNWQYLAVVKTDSNALTLAEVQVFGQ